MYGPERARPLTVTSAVPSSAVRPSVPVHRRDGHRPWSNHAYGQAVDLNPVENPYVGCGMTPRRSPSQAVPGPFAPCADGVAGRRPRFARRLGLGGRLVRATRRTTCTSPRPVTSHTALRPPTGPFRGRARSLMIPRVRPPRQEACPRERSEMLTALSHPCCRGRPGPEVPESSGHGFTTESWTMKEGRFLRIGGYILGGVLGPSGFVVIVLGAWGFSFTRDHIEREGITFGPATDPAVQKHAEQWAGSL